MKRPAVDYRLSKKMLLRALPAVLGAVLIGLPALANKQDPSPAEIDSIIQKFATNESAFAKARENYIYRQTAKVQVLDAGGAALNEKFELVTDITFTAEGKRTEQVVRAPVPTLQSVLLTTEDMEDLRNVQPFVLTANDIDKYHVRYLGRETLDEIPCYAFAVKPKTKEPGRRYFQGVIWVDDRDLQIVKSYGRGTGFKKKNDAQQFPKFETYREQIDGKYWFPTFTISDSVLPFENNPVRLKMTVRYEDYKQFKSDTKIIFLDEAPPTTQPPPQQQPAAPPKKP